MKCYVKYFISCAIVLTVLFSVFCVSSFAALQPTEKTFSSFGLDADDCLFNSASVSMNYNSNSFPRDIISDKPWEFWYDNPDNIRYSQMEFRWFTDDDFVRNYPGHIFQFELNDITTIGLSGFVSINGNKPYVKINYRILFSDSGWTSWESWKDFSYSRNAAGEFVIDFRFYYYNNKSYIEDIQFQIGVYSYTFTSSYNVGVKFPQYAINVYNGSANSPDAPKYSNPADKYQGSIDSNKDAIDDYTQSEEELLDGTEDGRDETNNLFDQFDDQLGIFNSGLLAITAAFNYFVDTSSFLRNILYISLTLGLVLFLFNAIPSFVTSLKQGKRGGSD